jgi:hypothetical protein
MYSTRMVRTRYGKGCGADLWWARDHTDGNEPFYRTCELSPSFGVLRCLLDCFYYAQYHRTILFDAILGGGKAVYTIYASV